MGITKLIVRRLILTIPVAIGVVTLIFAALSALSPVMRVAYFVGEGEILQPGGIDRAIQRLGLDQPIVVQYVNWLRRIVSLDFGRSLIPAAGGQEGPPALQMIIASLPATLELVFFSLPFIIAFSFWLGTKAATHHNKTVDHVVRVFGILGTSFPVFVIAGLLIMLSLVIQNPRQIYLDPFLRLSFDMGRNLDVRIASGTFTQYSGMISVDALLNGDIGLFSDAMTHLILPVATLVLAQGAALIRVTRSGLIEELGKPYVVSAKAKGLSKEEAVYKHARKNASVSVLTTASLLMGNMLTAIAIVEKVFGRPGFGSLLFSSAQTMNTPVLFTGAMFVALFFVLMNLAVDILYEYIDPRIRLG